MLLGWTSREPVIGQHVGIVTSNGLFRPFALVRGRAVATWGLTGGVMSLEPFAPISGEEYTALQAESRRILAFLGVTGAGLP